jgi:hypothetical protein
MSEQSEQIELPIAAEAPRCLPPVKQLIMLFTRRLSQHLVLRAFIVWLGIASAACWVFIIVVASEMERAGVGWLAAVLVIAWLIFSAPVMLVQLGLTFDVVWYAVTNRTFFYPMIVEISAGNTVRPSRTASALVTVSSFMSPFSGLALGAWVVLSRMPKSAHVLSPQIAMSIRESYMRRKQAEVAIADDFLNRLGLTHR